MGETCGWAYGVCNPCPYLGEDGNDDSDSPSSTTAPSPESTVDSSNSDDDDSSSSDATATADNSNPTSTSGASPAYLTKEDSPMLHWLVTVGLGGIMALAV
jgi:hypothetical protein